MSTEDKLAELMRAVDNLVDAAIDNSPKWDDLPIDQEEARAKVESLARDLAGPTQEKDQSPVAQRSDASGSESALANDAMAAPQERQVSNLRQPSDSPPDAARVLASSPGDHSPTQEGLRRLVHYVAQMGTGSFNDATADALISKALGAKGKS